MSKGAMIVTDTFVRDGEYECYGECANGGYFLIASAIGFNWQDSHATAQPNVSVDALGKCVNWVPKKNCLPASREFQCESCGRTSSMHGLKGESWTCERCQAKPPKSMVIHAQEATYGTPTREELLDYAMSLKPNYCGKQGWERAMVAVISNENTHKIIASTKREFFNVAAVIKLYAEWPGMA